MAILADRKNIQAANVAQSVIFTDAMEITNQRSASVQFSKTGAGKGTAKLQWSNDGQEWKDVNTTVHPDATALVAAGAATVHLLCDGIIGARVRLHFEEDNTGAVAITGGKWITKTY